MKLISSILSYFFLALFLITSTYSCKNNKEPETAVDTDVSETQNDEQDLFFKLSLAQWSLNPLFAEGELDPMDFAQEASEMGFEGIEYVSGYYSQKINNAENPEKAMQATLDSLKAKSEKYEVENVLIMVDGEGELAIPEESARNTAVENHKKWVDAAQFLGCHSIRVNLFGTNDEEEWKSAAVDGLTKLAEYAAEKNINVLVENHGYLSSNAALLVEVMEEVDMENCGTLPDFGNFCLRREGGEQWEAKCVEEYPIYQGVEELMPYAKAVSAKSYNFDDEGNETKIDFSRMLQIVKDAGYTGFIGVEYEGSNLAPKEGIIATKELLIKEGGELTNKNK